VVEIASDDLTVVAAFVAVVFALRGPGTFVCVAAALPLVLSLLPP
jgi:hypothetical protein